MRNYSNENEFELHENGCVGYTHFHMNGFTRRLVLTQRHSMGFKSFVVGNKKSFSSFFSPQIGHNSV